jgi:hypothetical protein
MINKRKWRKSTNQLIVACFDNSQAVGDAITGIIESFGGKIVLTPSIN